MNGTVSALAGSCPDLTFTLSGFTVYLTSATTFNRKSCNAMRDGDAIEVSGTLMTDGRVRAASIGYD